MSTRLEQFYKARRRKGYTYRSLAKVVGVSHEAISAYVHKKYPPRKDVWVRLKELLGLTGEVAEYWGREANNGRSKKYHEGDTCSIDNCVCTPVAKGLCRKHYQRLRYQHDKLIKKQKQNGSFTG